MSRYLRDLAKRHIENASKLMQKGKLEEALKEIEKVEKFAKQAKANDIYLNGQIIKGRLMQKLGNYEEALQIHTISLKATDELLSNDPNNENLKSILNENLDAVVFLGILFYNTGRFSKAEKCYEVTLSISQKLFTKDPENVNYQYYMAMILTNLGNLLRSMGRIQQSKDRFEKALDIQEKLLKKDPKNISYKSYIGTIHHNLGMLFFDTGRIEEAKDSYEKALEIYEILLELESENVVYQSDVAMLFNNLGTLLSKSGRFEEAIQEYEKALKFYEKLLQECPKNLEYKSDLATTLNNLGNLFRGMGRLEEAKKRYGKALKLSEELLQTDSESAIYQSNVAMTQNNLGNLLSNMGRFEEAKQAYEKTIICYEKLLLIDPENTTYQSNKATALNNLGTLLKYMCFFEEAKQRLEKALEIREKLFQTDPKNIIYHSHVGTTLNNLGTLLRDMGRIQEAYKRYEKALEMREKLVHKDKKNLEYFSDLATTLNNLGNLLSHVGHNEDAKNRYEKALKISEKVLLEDPENVFYQLNVAMTLNNLGVSLITGHPEESRITFEKAFDIYERLYQTDLENVAYQSNAAMTLNNLGNLLYGQGNYSAALGLHSRALDLISHSENLELLFRVYASMGSCYEKLYDYDNTFKSYNESIKCIESFRNQYSIEEFKLDFLWDKSHVYTNMISFLCGKLSNSEKSWEYLERFKSRSLLDSLRLLNLEAPKNIPKELISQEEKLLLSIRISDRLIRRANKVDELNQLTSRIKENNAELDKVYNQIRELSPEYVDLRKGQPLGIKEIKGLIGSQKKKTAFVEYLTTADKVFIFVMRSDKKIPKVKVVDLTEKSLRTYTLKYFDEIVDREGKYGEMWNKLSEYLVEPIFRYIKSCELVYFVPHGLLHYLPLHALIAENKRLIEHFPIVYVPSLTALKYSQSKPARKLESCLSLGYTLYEEEKEIFEGEAELVARLFNVEPKLGQEVTSDILRKSNKDLIHISCHGGFDWKNPLNSGLKLADKDLDIREIFDLDLSTGLLVLSACETGLNVQKPGDELIGLARAFLYAGAESLIVSLWSVRADSTLEFMRRFYRKIKEKNMNKAEALQQTQVEFIHNEKYSNPYLWAPFTLIGY